MECGLKTNFFAAPLSNSVYASAACSKGIIVTFKKAAIAFPPRLTLLCKGFDLITYERRFAR
jgi:hypothetical protein